MTSSPLRIGILGAAKIAPRALVMPVMNIPRDDLGPHIPRLSLNQGEDVIEVIGLCEFVMLALI